MRNAAYLFLAILAQSTVAAAKVDDPVAVIRRYYAAISSKNYRSAYECWTSGHGQTYAEFIRGFASTTAVEVRIGRPGPVTGAAGANYVDVPVDLRATLKSGRRQHFVGRYSLRLGNNVPASQAADRGWHLYSASLRSAP